MAKIRLTLSILALVSLPALIFTSCSGSDISSSSGISGDSDSEALNKLLGTWVRNYSYSTENYEAIEFSKNGYREYEYYDTHI